MYAVVGTTDIMITKTPLGVEHARRTRRRFHQSAS
jgi:hypothetical protein